MKKTQLNTKNKHIYIGLVVLVLCMGVGVILNVFVKKNTNSYEYDNTDCKRNEHGISVCKDKNNGLLNGITKLYYESGKIEFVSSWKDGKHHGPLKRYSENGILLEEIPFVDGKREGVGKSYYNDGKLKSVAMWKKGKLDGEKIILS